MASINSINNIIPVANLTISSGNLGLPATTSTVGQITQGGTSVFHTFGTQNTFIGSSAGNFSMTGNTNVGVGNTVMQSLTSATNCTAIGSQAMQGSLSGTANTAGGFQACNTLSSGVSNACWGYASLGNITTGSYNTCLGSQAGQSYTGSDSSNIAIGYLVQGTAGQSNTLRIANGTGTGNGQVNRTFVHGIRGITSASTNRYPVNIDVNGQLDGSGNVTLPTTTSSVGQLTINAVPFLHAFGTNNFFLGDSSGNFTLSGDSNTACGQNSLDSLTSGSNNSAFGRNALDACTSGGTNQAFGQAALPAITTSSGNCAFGFAAGLSVVTGTNNSFYGLNAGRNYTSNESYNICIGSEVRGTVGESNAFRVGNGTGTGADQINTTFISGIRGITTANADAIAVLIDSAGQLGTVSSSIRFKENIQDLPNTRVLELRPVCFNYKQDGRIGTGLIAEEVEQVMPQLVAYNQQGECESVKYHDIPVLLLAEIQKLRKELDELKKGR